MHVCGFSLLHAKTTELDQSFKWSGLHRLEATKKEVSQFGILDSQWAHIDRRQTHSWEKEITQTLNGCYMTYFEAPQRCTIISDLIIDLSCIRNMYWQSLLTWTSHLSLMAVNCTKPSDLCGRLKTQPLNITTVCFGSSSLKLRSIWNELGALIMWVCFRCPVFKETQHVSLFCPKPHPLIFEYQLFLMATDIRLMLCC